MEIKKLDLSLAAMKGRLIAKVYDADKKVIPHEALPDVVSQPLVQIHSAITGIEPFDPETETFKVIAKNGKFKALYGPQVLADSDGGTLIVRWGGTDYPLYLHDGELVFINEVYAKVKKPKLSFVQEEFAGYKKIVLKVTIPKGKVAYTTSIPVKLVEFKEIDGVADLLNMCVDTEDIDTILDKVVDIADTSDSTGIEGFVIKPSHLPLGVYRLTNYFSFDTSFGTGYIIQAQAEKMHDEEGEEIVTFDAIADIKDRETGNYFQKEVKISANEKFAINANNAMKKVLGSMPVMDDEKPGRLEITEKFVYNNYPAVKCDLQVTEFVKDENSFKTSW